MLSNIIRLILVFCFLFAGEQKIFCNVADDDELPQTLPIKRKSSVYRYEYYVSPSRYDFSVLAKAITKDCSDDYERLKALYLWTCDNIRYNAIQDARTADHVWESRSAVCQGYCELIYRMARSLGIKVDLVNGQVRKPSSKTEEHVWLYARVSGKKILFDPTWGAGFELMGKFYKSPEPLRWFDVDPQELIRTHYPEYKKFQLLKPAVEKEAQPNLP